MDNGKTKIQKNIRERTFLKGYVLSTKQYIQI